VNALLTPAPDADEIRRTLGVLFAPDAVIELRAMHKGRKRTDAGYFDGAHREHFVDAATKLNAVGAAVYVTLNPLDPQLLARCANRVQDFAQATATDSNITRRWWLLIDIDPQRPKDTSATAEQLEAAMERGRAVYSCLAGLGWPKPVVAESGNGYHLLYRIDLPNDDEHRDLIKHCLDALGRRFDDDGVKIDRSVFNAGRIVKLHGSVATKGDNIPSAPWRLSQLKVVPNPIEQVTLQQLEALAAEAAPAATKSNGNGATHSSDTFGRPWDMAAFLARGNLEASGPESHNGSQRWKLKVCPFNPDHGHAESAVFLAQDGRLGFKCLHNGCADRHWRDLRELVDGPRDSRRTSIEVKPNDGGAGVISFNSFLSYPEDARPWPEPLADAAYQGLVGDIVRAIEPETESDPAAILLQVLVAFGALVGRGPHVRIEGDEHHPNLFALLVGASAKARKGTSLGRVRQIFAHGAEFPRIVSGLSSGEGLKYHVRDERYEKQSNKKTGSVEEVLVDAGVIDKRLFATESEFAQVLRQVARAGNTLSATVRAAWDSGDLMTLTKNDPVIATGAHVCLVGHITVDELRAELTATDSANGFANRFLIMCVQRSKLLPFGGRSLSVDQLREIYGRVRAAAERARGLRSVGMTEAARQIWAKVYPRLSEGAPGLLGAVTARAEAQCIRLALVYALADTADQIDAPHLLAAISVWERCEASARHIFGAALGDRVADELLRGLRQAGPKGMTRTAIDAFCSKNEPAERIRAALDLLRVKGLATVAHKQGQPGRPAEIWCSGEYGINGLNGETPRRGSYSVSSVSSVSQPGGS
jgi:hypothetical protein